MAAARTMAGMLGARGGESGGCACAGAYQEGYEREDADWAKGGHRPHIGSFQREHECCVGPWTDV
jgi:hypothetical protein